MPLNATTSLLAGVALLANSALTGCSAETQPDFDDLRQRMVTGQLAGRDITNRQALRVMGSVPRHEFVSEAQRSMAYSDRPLPIGHDQTISQPYIVAFMTQALNPRTNDVVLEIGTGSGYQAAILSGLVKTVYSMEIVEPLAQRASADLKRLSFTNVHVRASDGYRGWPEMAPFDAIIVTCAPDHIPQPLVAQLKEGGRMIIPVGPTYNQSLYLLKKTDGKVHRESVLPVRFVPMTGRAEKPRP